MSQSISAREISRRLGQKYQPTNEQEEVIEAPLTPALVVAGAGSGKTETMAARVLWLVANGLVRPDEILGLTFTRKAAGELGVRIRDRLRELDAAGLLPASAPAEAGTGLEAFAEPVVSTYNAFAASVYRDHAMLIGRDGEAELLDETGAWLLARDVVTGSSFAELAEFSVGIGTMAERVLSLHHEAVDNEASLAELDAVAERLLGLGDLPLAPRQRNAENDEVRRLVGYGAESRIYAALAHEFGERKRERGLIEFADQVAFAGAIVRDHPQVGELLRDRHRVILLDEYQDTSVPQSRLLSALFRGANVTAVGDPNQSIYGWRGASAANMREFDADFLAPDQRPVHLALSTSFRNDVAILNAANAVLAGPRAGGATPADSRAGGATSASPRAGGAEVAELVARDGAGAGEVRFAHLATLDDEAEHVAGELDRVLTTARENGADAPSCAVLLRARAHLSLFAEALERRGIPHRILGLGGLLATPEIVDLTSALRVLHSAEAGSELIRLLVGPRYALPLDAVKQLSTLARLLARDARGGTADARVDTVMLEQTVARDEGASIVDALALIGYAPAHPLVDRAIDEHYLPTLRRAAHDVERWRVHSNLPLYELVSVIASELLLDIEVVANERRARPQAALDAFLDQVATFLRVETSPTLERFLRYLERAAKRDDLSPHDDEPEPGAVQLLTIHGAKGLEWDVVAMPRLVKNELPNRLRDGNGWVSPGRLPNELRLDRAALPKQRFEADDFEHQGELKAAYAEFRDENRVRHEAEERRLMYVGVTRAKRLLLLSGSVFGTGTTPSDASPYIDELREAGVVAAELLSAEGATAQREAAERDDAEAVELWPRDPLGRRRERFAAAARRALAAREDAARPQPDSTLRASRWRPLIELLLHERAERSRIAQEVELPERVPASALRKYLSDPSSVAAKLRRPMPQEPNEAASRGTEFHAWVERHYGHGSDADRLDDVEGAAAVRVAAEPSHPSEGGGVDADDIVDAPSIVEVGAQARAARERQLAAWRETFLASEWAAEPAVAVEVAITMRLGQVTTVNTIDAVFETDDGYLVVDWKTGRVPESPEEIAEKALQIAQYRLAFARFKGIDPSRVKGALYYVAHDVTLRFDDELPDEATLTRMLEAAIEGQESGTD